MTTRTPFDLFIDGARKGWTVGTNSIIPNLVMAFALTEILQILGVLNLLGKIFGPFMGLFGLPGESITILLTSWISMAAGVGITASLFKSGVLNGTHVTILIAAIYLMGAQLQYMGRLLGVSAVPKRYWPVLFATSILNALISMLFMRFVA
jgi:spore maturation protein SpmB